jgi:multidrug efflux system outer membrane protein
VTVAAETARAYAEVCTLGEEIAVAEHSLEVISHEEEITAARHDAGANSDFDVVRAQALVAQVRATLPTLHGQRRAALFQQALSAYTAELDHHHEILGFQAKSQRAFDLARTQFAAGSVSNLDLLSAEQSLVTADAQVAASDAAVVQNEVSIFKALGGGWNGNGR